MSLPASAVPKSKRKSETRIQRYNLYWHPSMDPLMIERDMIRRGGQWTKSNGETAGEGLFYHYRKFQELAWPDKIWSKGPFVNHWAEVCLENYINYTYIGAMGCAASGKSSSFGSNALTDWYCFSECTTILVSSTDLKSLELRIWGMIKQYHKSAKASRPWIPGYLIEGKQMIILDPKRDAGEGRDFKNGIMAVACKRGNQFVGLGPLIGIHNKRVRLIADESNLMPRAFLDAAANLSKCEDFKLVALGNPNETTNAHGVICEPSAELGGWESGVDQSTKTKTWPTRFPNGICLQLPGSDSPNMTAPEDEEPPFPFLMTRQQMKDDAQIWGVDDWHFTMMNDARMPRGQGSRRVLTRQMCQKFKAFHPPRWRDTRKTSIAFLDAAYRGTGGDRCVFGEFQFGQEAVDAGGEVVMSQFINQDQALTSSPQIIALVDLMVVPIGSEISSDSAEDQIVAFCRKECEARGIAPGNMFYDAGMKTSLVTAFCRLWSTDVESIDCGGSPTESRVSTEIAALANKYYSKFITELWYSVRYTVESGQFRGMTEEACTEFCQREWKMVSGNRIEVESKADMKLKTGRSPDLADAIAVGLQGARRRGFVIARMVPKDEDKEENNRFNWRREWREKADKLNGSGQLNYAA